jgi:hypothetical protein
MKSLKRVRKRHGRCYELAFRAVTEAPEAEGLKLVHGSAVLNLVAGERVDHAWVLLPGSHVYDPVFDLYFTERDFAEKHKAVVSRVYTRMEAMKTLLENNHYGPWT